MKTADIAKLITFGLGGHTVEYGKHHRTTGYDKPDSPPVSDAGLDIPDGTPAINKIPAVEAGPGIKLAISGPMVDVDLAPGQVDKCPEPSPMFADAVADNSYGTMLTMQKAARATLADYGPLDCIDTANYIDLWEQAGAIIGHYKDNAIVWH